MRPKKGQDDVEDFEPELTEDEALECLGDPVGALAGGAEASRYKTEGEG